MIFGSLMMVIAIAISAIAAWYSIAGLTAIFSAAVIPVIIMGGSLEAGKIVATVWLHNNWRRAGWAFKSYLIPAIVFLMLLTSMGIFGFLSKAHSDQSLVTGDATSKVAIYDEKIATERENIAQAKKAIEQMNAQVDSMLGRTDSDTGAQKAVNIRKSQSKERAELQVTINKSQKEIQRLQEERAPLAAEARKVEAEVGPIKYIAALIYGDNPDQNILERAVRWVIILIVIVFDPLALTLILAANKQFEWARHGTGGWVHDEEEQTAPVVAATDGATAESPPQPEPFDPAKVEVTDEEEEFFNKATLAAQAADVLDEQNRAADANAEVAQIVQPEDTIEIEYELTVQEEPKYEADNGPLSEGQIQQVRDSVAELYVPKDEDIAAYNDERLVSKFDKIASQEEEKSVEEAPIIEDTPPPPVEDTIDEYDMPIRRGADYAVRYKGKVYNLDAFNSLFPGMAIQADNDKLESASQCGFGDQFPTDPMKGDMFIRTDYLPDRLFKWNGAKWIEVDKNSTDSYTYNQAYIQHLISKLEAGEYDIEDLSDAEQSQVEQQIQEILKNKNA